MSVARDHIDEISKAILTEVSSEAGARASETAQKYADTQLGGEVSRLVH